MFDQATTNVAHQATARQDTTNDQADLGGQVTTNQADLGAVGASELIAAASNSHNKVITIDAFGS